MSRSAKLSKPLNPEQRRALDQGPGSNWPCVARLFGRRLIDLGIAAQRWRLIRRRQVKRLRTDYLFVCVRERCQSIEGCFDPEFASDEVEAPTLRRWNKQLSLSGSNQTAAGARGGSRPDFVTKSAVVSGGTRLLFWCGTSNKIEVAVRKTSSVLSAILLAASLALPAKAQDFTLEYYGNELLDDCSKIEKATPDNDREVIQVYRCLGFLQGVIGGVTLIDGVRGGKVNANTPHLFGAFCIPESATLLQGWDVVLKFLREHPERRHEPAANLVSLALFQAFPCA